MSAPRRILLVEDDRDQAMLFAQVLAMAGYETVTSPDAETAARLMADAATPFDLLLVDWDLPGKAGDAFITEVKARSPYPLTVLYSNHAHVAHAAKACRADGWLCKSEGIIRLREVIAQVLAG